MLYFSLHFLQKIWPYDAILDYKSIDNGAFCNNFTGRYLKLLEMTVAGLFGDKIGVELLSKYLSVPGGFGRIIIDPGPIILESILWQIG